MNRIQMYMKDLGRGTRVVVLALAVIFVSAGIAQATSTTIDTSVATTNLTASGTLGVTGQTTLGNATSTMLSAHSAYFGGIGSGATSTFATSGALALGGALTGTTASFTSTLGVTGLATLSGGATTTQITLLSGDIIKNSAASTTAISGSITADANLTLNNAQAATSTMTAACIITTATSSLTKIRLMYNTQATTSINGGTVQGVVLWGYGSTCLL